MTMIAIVRFAPKEEMSPEEYKASLQKMMPMFEEAPGLHRKYFCSTESGSAGIYEWQTREHAEAFYDKVGQQLMQQIASDYTVELLSANARLDNDTGTADFYI